MRLRDDALPAVLIVLHGPDHGVPFASSHATGSQNSAAVPGVLGHAKRKRLVLVAAVTLRLELEATQGRLGQRCDLVVDAGQLGAMAISASFAAQLSGAGAATCLSQT